MKKSPSHLELFQDSGFTSEEWSRHATWVRHVPEPKIFVRVLLGLLPVCLWTTLVSTAVGLYATFAQTKGWPVAVSADYIQPFALTSFAVSLLLVFRTNSSYGRWWEARTACGRMLNCTRNAARMAISWLPPGEEALLQQFVRWDAALAATAMAYIRGGDAALLGLASDLLSPEELAWLASCGQAPVAVLQVLSALLARSSLSAIERSAIEAQLSDFDVAVGAAERISRQPIPLAYTRHTSRFILIWLTFLPFALWGFLSWLTIPTLATVTFLLIGTENIGIQIEQPYRVLPLASMATGCKAAVQEMMAQRKRALQLAAAGLPIAAPKAQGPPRPPFPPRPAGALS